MEGLRCSHAPNAHIHDHHSGPAEKRQENVINIEIQNLRQSQANLRSPSKPSAPAPRRKPSPAKAAKNKGMGSFHFRGLRELNLSKNLLGVDFIDNLSKCLLYDGYVRSVDLSFNNLRAKELSELLGQRTISLNANLQNFDVFGNPGTMLEPEGRLITKRIALELL